MKRESMTCYNLEIAYSALAVFDSTTADPFSQWSEQEWQQGFSWRKESVCFRTLEGFEVGMVEVAQQSVNKLEVAQATTRAIVVPFEVSGSDGVTISTPVLSQDRSILLKLLPGSYKLLYEAEKLVGPGHRSRYRFSFVTEDGQSPIQAEILRADSELSPRYPLIMAARAA